MTTFASALPRKRFFLDMFTRDIRLDECILDLIDNSIDGLVRSRGLMLSGQDLLRAPLANEERLAELPVIDLRFDASHLEIEDECGGISLAEAQQDVFNFGHSVQGPPSQRRLGAYGIGLKRAVFKIGKRIEMRSQSTESGFQLDLDVDGWAANDATIEDWRIPISSLPGNTANPGTRIKISSLRSEVEARLASSTFGTLLERQIGRTYMLFLDRSVRVRINGVWVPPFASQLGRSDEVSLASDEFEHDGVHVRLVAGLAARGERGEWKEDNAGWYVFCSGRAVAVADRSAMTGWDGGPLPLFQPKFRGFLGFAFFEAEDPLKLPWTTTKRGLNAESPVFQAALNRMGGLARPITSFLDRMYRGEPTEDSPLRSAAGGVRPVDNATLAQSAGISSFKVTPRRRLKTTIRVQFDAERCDVELISKHLRQPKVNAGQVGLHCLEYYLRAEGLR